MRLLNRGEYTIGAIERIKTVVPDDSGGNRTHLKVFNNIQYDNMRNLITRNWWISFLILFSLDSFSQNLTLDFKTHCLNSTDCNPFRTGYACQQSVILQATHGSPAFYLPATNTTRQIELLAKSASNGTMLSEGVTLAYPFIADRQYTIKIKHQGRPQTGAVIYPNLIAALTNTVPRLNDGCDLGYLTATDVYTSFTFFVSQTAQTSSFTITPTTNVSLLWLRSNGIQNEEAGLLLHSIEIVDHSVTTPPTPPPTYGCNESLDFCDTDHRYAGSMDFRVTTPLTIPCDAFWTVHSAGSSFFRRFCSTEIIFAPGFIASSYDHEVGQNKTFRALASATPCNQPLSGNSINNSFEELTKPQNDIAQRRNDGSDIVVYPSYSNGMVKIAGNPLTLAGAQIVALDQSGKTVFQYRNKSETNLLSLNLSHLSNGIYFVKVMSGTKMSTHKILISK